MIVPVDLLVGLAGLIVLGLVLWDVFQGVVVPRPTPGRLRNARYVIPPTWRTWRNVVVRVRTGHARDALLGLKAPGAAILLLLMWLALLIVGYGLIFYALRGDLRPSPASPLEALYFAGTSVLTIGYGDIVPVGGVARVAVVAAATTGLGLVALVITFLYSLFGSYQRREIAVVTLSARAKSPPSAITLLETYAKLGMVSELPDLLRHWEEWIAEVLDTHVSYPLLGYFRSSHDNVSWISSLGAVLDAAVLVRTTIVGVPRGQAIITTRVGAHLVEDISNNLRLGTDGAAVDEDQFAQAYERLARAGYELESQHDAWRAFARARASYAGRLQALADYWATPATEWVGYRVESGSPVHRPHPATAPAPEPMQERP
jgi:hypothetical protein